MITYAVWECVTGYVFGVVAAESPQQACALLIRSDPFAARAALDLVATEACA